MLKLLALVLIGLVHADVEEQKPTPRLATSMEFVDALTHAKNQAVKLSKLKPAAIGELIDKGHYDKAGYMLSSLVSAYSTEKSGLYTYMWGTGYADGFHLRGIVVEFFSGGLWFQVTPSDVYWYDSVTGRGCRLSPVAISNPTGEKDLEEGKSVDGKFLPIGLSIAREFSVPREVHSPDNAK